MACPIDGMCGLKRDPPRGGQAAHIQRRTVQGSELERRNSTPTRRIHYPRRWRGRYHLRQRPGQNSNVSIQKKEFTLKVSFFLFMLI